MCKRLNRMGLNSEFKSELAGPEPEIFNPCRHLVYNDKYFTNIKSTLIFPKATCKLQYNFIFSRTLYLNMSRKEVKYNFIK